MAKPHWFPFYTNDFLSSSRVSLMSTEEIGAYVLLLCHAWNDPTCSLPPDEPAIRKLGRFAGDLSLILSCFVTKKGRLINERLYAEWIKVNERSELAKKSASVRWHKKENALAMRSHMRSQCSSQSQSQSEKEKKKSLPLRAIDDQSWIEDLKKNPAYQHVNFAVEFGKMDAWFSLHPTRKKTKTFIMNWLNKVEPPVSLPARKERLPL